MVFIENPSCANSIFLLLSKDPSLVDLINTKFWLYSALFFQLYLKVLNAKGSPFMRQIGIGISRL